MPSCINPGSRDQNIYTADTPPGGLFAAAPETFRPSNIPHAYPVYVENRSAQGRLFRLTIGATAFASFTHASFDAPTPTDPNPLFGQLFKVSDVAIGPYSTVTGSVVVGAGQADPVTITVHELASSIVGPNVVSDGTLLVGGARTVVTLSPAPLGTATNTETHAPVVAPTPTITHPLEGQLPFTITPQTPFSQTPFSQTTGSRTRSARRRFRRRHFHRPASSTTSSTSASM